MVGVARRPVKVPAGIDSAWWHSRTGTALAAFMDVTQQTWRSWIWTFVIVQGLGLTIDAVWHGLLHPDFEPPTYRDMVWHLATVHLPLYLGVVGLFGSVAWAVSDRGRRSTGGLPLLVAFVGAAVQLAGEMWHAYSHLQFRPTPVPELIGVIGFAVVIGATVVFGRAARGAGAGPARERMTR